MAANLRLLNSLPAILIPLRIFPPLRTAFANWETPFVAALVALTAALTTPFALPRIPRVIRSSPKKAPPSAISRAFLFLIPFAI